MFDMSTVNFIFSLKLLAMPLIIAFTLRLVPCQLFKVAIYSITAETGELNLEIDNSLKTIRVFYFKFSAAFCFNTLIDVAGSLRFTRLPARIQVG